MKKSFTLAWVILLQVFFFLGGGKSLAQQYVQGNLLTAEELKTKVTEGSPLHIAIRGVHPNVYANGYFYNDGSANGTHAYSATDCVWLLEKVSGEDLYYLRHEGTTETANYAQQNDAKHLGAESSAAKFRIVYPTTSGSGETKWGKSVIWSEAPEDHLVRFVNSSSSNWFRFGGGTDVTYKDGTANGDYTVFLVYELKASVNVTFNIYDENDKKLGTDVVSMVPGAAVSYTVPSYVTITSKSFDDATTVPDEGGTYDIHTRATLPFTVSSTTGDDAVWTLLKIRSTLWVFGNAEDGLVHTEAVEPTSSTADAYQWCVTGDWYNGFVLTNKATGKHMANLGAKNPNPEQTGWAAISLTDDDATADAHRFKYVADANGAFAFQLKGTSNYLSNTFGVKNKILCIYNTVDDGSRLRATNSQQLVTDMKNDWTFSRNSVGGYAGADLAGLEDVTDLTSAYAFKEGLESKSVIAFDASKYYRIKNYSRDRAFGFNHTEAGNGAFIGTNKDENGAAINAYGQSMSEAASLWKFIGDADNGYKIYNLNAKKYVGKTASSSSQYLTLTDNADEAGIYSLTPWSGATGQYQIACTNGNGGNTQLHVSGQGVMNYNGGVNDPSSWYLQPAETFEVNLSAVGDAHWSSLYLPFAVEVPEAAKFYVASSKGDDCVNLTPVTGTLPAEQGVVVKSDTESKLTLNVLADAESAEKQNNVLEGTLETKTITTDDRDSYYVLGASADNVGLYHPSATTLKANRAYIPTSSVASPQVLRFVFDGNDVTGISQVGGEKAANVYYDLTGRRVSQPRHGIYVVNKKKVFIP